VTWWERHWQHAASLGAAAAVLGCILVPASWTWTPEGIITRYGVALFAIAWWFRPGRKP
jgi:hypothetical protein